MDVVIIFVFMFCVRMTAWTKEKTLLLIEQIVWDIKSKEYKDANVCNNIFEANGNSFSCTKKRNQRQMTQ
jgi:hypothetical protein